MQIQLKKPLVYIFVFGTLLFLISLASGLINYALINLFHFKINMNNKFAHEPFWFKLIVGSLVAPFLETYFFQQLPYTILKKWNANNTIIILISSVLFGLSHFYSLYYMIFGFFAGIVLIKAFINWQGTLNSKYLITVGIHSMANLYVTIFSFFFP